MMKKMFISLMFLLSVALYAQPKGYISPTSVTRSLSDADMQPVENFGDINKDLVEQVSLALAMFQYRQGLYPYGMSKNKFALYRNFDKDVIRSSIPETIDELDILPSQVENEANLITTNNLIDSKPEILEEVLPIESDEEDDLEFFDALTGEEQKSVASPINEKQIAPSGEVMLTVQDITAQDEYSGWNAYFDQLYQVAKRDLYLMQQHAKMNPDRKIIYENLKKYYVVLGQQRKEMAMLKQAMGLKLSKAFDKERIDISSFDEQAQHNWRNYTNRHFKIYHENVVKPKNAKNLIDYKIPLIPGFATEKQPQIQLNQLDLLKAQIVVDQLQKQRKR